MPLPGAPECLAHATSSDLEAELQRLLAGESIDARRVRFDSELIERVLGACPTDAEGRKIIRNARFDGAVFARADFRGAKFEGVAHFAGAHFQSLARFHGATFEGEARFYRATFDNGAGFESARFGGAGVFRDATFDGEARFQEVVFDKAAVFERVAFDALVSFGNATFSGPAKFGSMRKLNAKAIFTRSHFKDTAEFGQAPFGGEARFTGSRFEGRASFFGADFHGAARFGGSHFRSPAVFTSVTFEGVAYFLKAIFEQGTQFSSARFHDEAIFSGSAFEKDARFGWSTFDASVTFANTEFANAGELGPILIRRELILDGSLFGQRVLIEASAGSVRCQGVQFREGANLRLRWASLMLDGTDYSKSSTLSGTGPFRDLDETPFRSDWEMLAGPPDRLSGQPWIASLRHADVNGLALSNIDLRCCHFFGAHNLDRLRIGADVRFDIAPRLRAKRQVIAEEQSWRAVRRRSSSIRRSRSISSERQWTWQKPSWPQLAEAPQVLMPRQIGAMYRALRKGKEDAKDQPGAADFYYGEMEMRRRGAPLRSVERFLLTLYWLASGYALRAWRAFASLLLAVLLAAVIFATVGFEPLEERRFVPVRVDRTGDLVYAEQQVEQPSAWNQFSVALGYSAETATSVLRGPERAVTTIGIWTRAILRWIGPILFALALLSLRGRVKR